MTNRSPVASLRPSTQQPRPTLPGDGQILYRPLVHQFKCRGVLRLDDKTAVGGPNNDGGGDPLEAIPSSLCRGIATRLETVGSLPPTRTPEEAEMMFRGVISPAEKVAGVRDDITEEYERRRKDQDRHARVRRIGGGGPPDADGVSKVGGDRSEGAPSGGGEKLSCYGTTNVSVLTVQQVPVSALGQGRSAIGAFLNPFSMLGGMGMHPPPSPGEKERRSGDGGSSNDDFPSPAVDPWRNLFGDAAPSRDGGPAPGRPFAGGFGPFGPMLGGMTGGSCGGYKSMSTTSRVVDGKRVTTTETTTVVDGKRRTVKEITTVHPDGRKEVVTEGDDGGDANATSSPSVPNERGPQHPFHHRRQATDPFRQPQASPPKVLAVMHDCRLGLELSDSLYDDKRSGTSETTVRVGSFGFTMASEYDVEDNNSDFEDARKDGGKKTEAEDEGREQASEGKIAAPRTRRRDTGHGKPPVSSAENGRSREGTIKDPMFYLSRTAQSMERNAKALYEVVSETDFPDRVVEGGRKVAGNFGQTYERMEKLAGDVYRFWADDDEDGQSGGRGGGWW